MRFYQNVQPAGAWQPVRQHLLSLAPTWRKHDSFPRDALNTLLAVLAICGLYVGTLYLIVHRDLAMLVCFGAALVPGVALYFTWYKHLPPPSAPEVMQDT
jgi:hypothetical protein